MTNQAELQSSLITSETSQYCEWHSVSVSGFLSTIFVIWRCQWHFLSSFLVCHLSDEGAIKRAWVQINKYFQSLGQVRHKVVSYLLRQFSHNLFILKSRQSCHSHACCQHWHVYPVTSSPLVINPNVTTTSSQEFSKATADSVPIANSMCYMLAQGDDTTSLNLYSSLKYKNTD